MLMFFSHLLYCNLPQTRTCGRLSHSLPDIYYLASLPLVPLSLLFPGSVDSNGHNFGRKLTKPRGCLGSPDIGYELDCTRRLDNKPARDGVQVLINCIR